jgi:hypothetical protein
MLRIAADAVEAEERAEEARACAVRSLCDSVSRLSARLDQFDRNLRNDALDVIEPQICRAVRDIAYDASTAVAASRALGQIKVMSMPVGVHFADTAITIPPSSPCARGGANHVSGLLSSRDNASASVLSP